MNLSNDLKDAIAAYLNGTASAEQKKIVNDWYSGFDDEHVIVESNENLTAESVEQKIKLRLLQTITSQPETKVVPLFPQKKKRSRYWWVAAAVACCILFAILYQRDGVKPLSESQVVQTRVGEIKELLLPDSSRVWLNAMSTITIPENFSTTRAVVLDGEGFFDVKQQLGKTFVVKAGGTETTVLGTAFSISSYQPEKEIMVAVLRGKVQVSDGRTKSSILTKGKLLKYSTTNRMMEETQKEMQDMPDWVAGQLTFDATSLEKITETLSRWYGVQFVFENEALKNCNYTGNFTSEMQLSKLLELFSTINNIKYEINEDETQIKLYGDGCN